MYLLEPGVAVVGLGAPGEQAGHRRDLDLLVRERDERLEVALGERAVGLTGSVAPPPWVIAGESQRPASDIESYTRRVGSGGGQALR